MNFYNTGNPPGSVGYMWYNWSTTGNFFLSHFLTGFHYIILIDVFCLMCCIRKARRMMCLAYNVHYDSFYQTWCLHYKSVHYPWYWVATKKKLALCTEAEEAFRHDPPYISRLKLKIYNFISHFKAWILRQAFPPHESFMSSDSFNGIWIFMYKCCLWIETHFLLFVDERVPQHW